MNEEEDLCPDWHGTPILFKKGDKIIIDDRGCHIIPMADPNTCEQCGVTNSNRTNIVIRQSGKGKLVCQACYDIIHPEEKVIMENISKEPSTFIEFNIDQTKDNKPPLLYKNESLSSSKEKEEKGAFRPSPKRFQR